MGLTVVDYINHYAGIRSIPANICCLEGVYRLQSRFFHAAELRAFRLLGFRLEEDVVAAEALVQSHSLWISEARRRVGHAGTRPSHSFLC